jgi:hypothetical protein
MKVLIATQLTQGERRSDFCFTIDGEIVIRALDECKEETVDGSCGCRRSLVGLDTSRTTTTFQCVDIADLTFDKLLDRIAAHLVENGWFETEAAAFAQARFQASQISKIAEKYAEGTILERRGERYGIRRYVARVR